MKQFLLIDNKSQKLYHADNVKKAARMAFRDHYKMNKVQQCRICLENTETKNRNYFIAMTNEKLESYDTLINEFNPNQKGGANNELLYDKLEKLSEDIGITSKEITKILDKKQNSDFTEKLTLIVDDNYDELDKKIDKNSKSFDELTTKVDTILNIVSKEDSLNNKKKPNNNNLINSDSPNTPPIDLVNIEKKGKECKTNIPINNPVKKKFCTIM